MTGLRHLRLNVLGLLAAVLAIASSAGRAEMPHRWATYSNVRFGYALCYPADLLRPQAEADNGDGRVFTGDGGVELRVWGNYNALEQSLAEAMREVETQLAKEGATVTYRAARANWFVLSGRSDGKLFYSRRVLTGDRYSSFDLQYPARAAPLWNPVAARLSRCFSP